MFRTPLYTLSEAATLLGVSVNLVTFLVVLHEVPFRPIGRAKVIDRDGLDRLRAHAADYRRKLQAVAV